MTGSSFLPLTAVYRPEKRNTKKVPFVELFNGRVQGVVSSGSDINRVYVAFFEAGTGDFYCLEVPHAQKDDVASLMAYRGLTFSTSASTRGARERNRDDTGMDRFSVMARKAWVGDAPNPCAPR